MGGWHSAGWWIIAIMMIAFWGGLFWLFSRVIAGRLQRSAGTADISAKEIAARRFASGELDENEYSRMVERLEG